MLKRGNLCRKKTCSQCWPKWMVGRELLIQRIFTSVLNKSTFPEVNNASNKVEIKELITAVLSNSCAAAAALHCKSIVDKSDLWIWSFCKNITFLTPLIFRGKRI